MTLSEQFKGYKIEEAEIADTPKGKLYEIELEKGEETLEVHIDLNGKVISKTETEEEND